MPKAIDMALRKTIAEERRKKGTPLSALASKYGVSYASVQSLCARYQEQGEEGLKTAYHHCGKKRPGPKDFTFRAVRCFKQWHPYWGAEKIRTEILLLRPGLKIPPARTLQQWFHYTGQAKVRNHVPRPDPCWYTFRDL